MPLDELYEILRLGQTFTYPKGQVIYSLDFDQEFYLVNKGYIKRCSISDVKTRSVQSMYGPGYFFPLTPVFTKLLNYNVGQESATYLYETMTDVEICGISNAKLAAEVEANPKLYSAILFEAARRIKSNIHRLENNALTDSFKKLGHHLTYLVEEFGDALQKNINETSVIAVPLTVTDIAEQIDTEEETIAEALEMLMQQKIIAIDDTQISVLNLNLLRDTYLA